MVSAMNPRVRQSIQEIGSDRAHGAGWLARAALRAMELAAKTSEATTAEGFLREIGEVAKALSQVKPTMVVIANGVCRLLDGINEAEQNNDLESLRRLAIGGANNLVAALEEALLGVARRAATLLDPNDTVITCSYSSAAIETFAEAHRRGKAIGIIAAESRGEGGRRYGQAMADALRSRGIRATVVADDEIGLHVARASKALVGADAILADGSIVNGVPTRRLAEAARECGVPLYCAAESLKITSRKQLPLETGFDHVPASLVAMIITEVGVLAPTDVAAVAQGLQQR